MADRLRRLERELGLAAAPSPFAADPKAICRRVETILSAQEQERKRYMKYKIRLAATFVATAVALTSAAFAAGPAINEMLQTALGGFVPFAQPLDGIVEDQGFRLQVLSALTDANNAVVYAELTDLTGDRLENAEIGGRLDLPLEGETSYSHSCTIVSYDPEAKTALLRFEKDAGVLIPEGAEGTIILSSIQPEHHDFSSVPIPAVHIPDRYLDHMTLPTGETVLVPEQNPLDLEGRPGEPVREGAHLSSAGFAADGRLHYLIRFPEEADAERSHTLVTTYSKRWQSPADGSDSFFNEDGKFVQFTLDGVAYCDYSTKAALADRGDLKEITGLYGTYVAAEKIKWEEPWCIPVKLSVVEDTVYPLTGLIDHNTLQELRLSPVGVSLFSTSPDYTQIGGYPLTVFLSDGTSFHPEAGTHGHQKDGPNMARWIFDRPVEVSEITGVALGAWMIPIENGVAGGYWLPAWPE